MSNIVMSMQKNAKILVRFLIVVTLLTSGQYVGAANYYHANGGSYWTQYGSSWNRVNNDGYCVSGRGPCGSSLWYQQWTYNRQGCGYDEWGHWTMSQIVPYYGKVSAWIDGWGGGTMPAANYAISFNYGSSYYPYPAIDQSKFYEEFVLLTPKEGLYRVGHVSLTDSWGGQSICNSYGGYRVEFDEIKLEV